MVAGPCIQGLDCGHGRLSKSHGLLLRLYSDLDNLTVPTELQAAMARGGG